MHENADLAGMRRAEVEHVKAFASRQVDRARPAYGRVTERRPRRSIDWGTTNNSEYLQSQTGNRRFWTLAVGRIDIDALKYDRLLLLGEAAAREAEGESVTLDASLWPDAREAQEARRIKDPWEDLLGDIPEHVTVDAGSLTERTVQIIRRTGDGKQKVASADLLAHVLRVPTAQMNSSHGQRLALAMKHAKWQRNPTGKVTIDGVPVRGYWRLDPTDKQGGLALEYPAGHRAK
jgi:predicted P-loop ATPase